MYPEDPNRDKQLSNEISAAKLVFNMNSLADT
jgi:hypothetical protein